METKDILLGLLRSEVFGEAADEALVAALELEGAAAALRLAKQHDLAHIAAAALMRLGFFERAAQDAQAIAEEENAAGVQEGAQRLQKIQELKSKCERAQMVALYRYENLQFALGEIGRVLSAAQVAFMPLKGSVIRAFYKTPWHRSSCDIDVLVHEEDLDRACEALAREAGYRIEGNKNFHDIHLYSPAGIHLELHFSILSGNEKYDAVLSKVWEYSEKNANESFHFEQSKAFFFFHHIAHMAYHFSSGGCGIKPFLDLCVMEKYMGCDREGAAPLLAQAGLSRFAEEAVRLARAWFLGGARGALSQKMERYLLLGGVYGTVENKVLMHQNKKGGRLRYALSRIFLSRRSLARIYPVLERHPWLLPVMQVRRWFRLLFSDGLKRGVRELSVNREITAEQAGAADRFMQELGL